MALELALAKGALDGTNETLVIEDSTGAYNATTNTTGYGTPNPARAVLGLFLRAFNNRYEGEEDVTGTLLTATADDSDPVAVTQWTLALAEDGWIKATVYGLNLLDVDTSLQLDELVWDADNNLLKRIATKSGSGPYTYTTVSAVAADLDNSDYQKAYSTVFNTYAIPALCDCHLKSVEKYLDSEDEDDRKLSLKIQAYLISIRNSFLTESPAEGQKMVERAEAICECFNENCDC
jgi:hypothetical protein